MKKNRSGLGVMAYVPQHPYKTRAMWIILEIRNFSRGFYIRENKTLAKWQNHSVISTDVVNHTLGPEWQCLLRVKEDLI